MMTGKVWLSEAEKVSQLASSKEMDSANNLNDPGSEPPPKVHIEPRSTDTLTLALRLSDEPCRVGPLT